MKSNESKPFVKCREVKNIGINTFASDNNQLLLIEDSGLITQINSSDLLQNWNITLGSKLKTTASLEGEDILLISDTEADLVEKHLTIIRQMNALTGITDWILNLEQAGSVSVFRNSYNKNIVFISEDLNTGLIDTNSGKILWQIDLLGQLKSYTSDRNHLFILTSENRLLQINLEKGTVTETNNLSLKKITKIYSNSGQLYAGDTKGVFYKYLKDKNSFEKLFRTGGEISFISMSEEGNMLVSSNDNFLYFYSAEKEKVLWKKRLSGRITLEPIIFQDSIYVTTSSEPLIYIIRQNDGSQTNQINVGQNNFIKKLDVNQKGLFILTGSGLLNYSADCQEKRKNGLN